MRQLIRRALKSSLGSLSWCAQSARKRISGETGEGQVIILAYHRVVGDIEKAEREGIPGLAVSVETFRQHLELIRDQYEVLTLDEGVKVIRGEKRAGRAAAVVTFDDGYRDVYEFAFPVLRRMGLPATVFVPTAYIGTNTLLDHDRVYWLVLKAQAHGLSLRESLLAAGAPSEQVASLCAESGTSNLADRLVHLPFQTRQRFLLSLEERLGNRRGEYPSDLALMSWEMVTEMAEANITIGSHSNRHMVLTYETEETIRREFELSKQMLEERLNLRVHHFAYPNGRYNAAIQSWLKCLGFDVALTTERRVARRGDDPLTLGRIFLSEESTRGVMGKYSAVVARMRLAA